VRYAFDADSIHYLGKWEGGYRALEILTSLGPEWHSTRLSARYQCEPPPPLALVMDATLIKSITHWAV
jgi:hypothetical protein